MEPIAVYQQVAEYAAQFNDGVTRAEVAQHFGIGKGGAKDHLERCVQHGLLSKSYTWIKRNCRGWVYFKPYHMSPLEIAEAYAARGNQFLSPEEARAAIAAEQSE